MGRGHGTCCKRIIASVLGAAIIATIVAVCVVYIPKNRSHTIDDGPKVTNEDVFENGGASKHPAKNHDGKDDAKDEYTYYQGKVDSFPNADDWVSFDHMWKSNKAKMKTACTDHSWGENNSDDEMDQIKDAIQYVSKASLVDHRLILAVIIQESKGCLRVTSTDSVHGVHNPGLMQSHDGSSYDEKHSSDSIRQMIKDGTQGTPKGDGLVQVLDRFGDAYSAARAYNSGDVAKSGDLSDAIGATPCYASDVANRLTGWGEAKSKCDDEKPGVAQSEGSEGQSQSDAGTSGQQSQDTSVQSTSSDSSSTSGANPDGTFSGGHWDINGNYVKDDGGGGSKRRRARRDLVV
ncbi:putative transglycosylase SLT domain 1, Lysozyme-like domain superfamily [Septoria linicola]|nr:putative transglycosylase SLT domain 1, Lysozyme-like domain superfamily [Septoria linicola]